jgi:heme-degrading monooxygenase HmoA
MIVREWRAWAVPPNDTVYEEHFRSSVVPHLQEMPGCIGAQLLRRKVGDKVELVAMTTYESLDAIRAFAGEDLERAVVAPEARAVLARFDDRCRHYEVRATLDIPER